MPLILGQNDTDNLLCFPLPVFLLLLLFGLELVALVLVHSDDYISYQHHIGKDSR